MSLRLILTLLLIGTTGDLSARTEGAAASHVFSSNTETTALVGTYATVFRIASVEYVGQIEFTTHSDGTTTGRLKLRAPIAMSGEVTVKTAGTTLRFEMSYVRDKDGCAGDGSGSGSLLRDGREVTGDVEIVDCRSHPRSGSFEWTRE